MRLTCRCCRGQLGLGVVTAKVWVPEKWWFEVRRFCSGACRVRHLEELEDTLRKRRAVQTLNRQPP